MQDLGLRLYGNGCLVQVVGCRVSEVDAQNGEDSSACLQSSSYHVLGQMFAERVHAYKRTVTLGKPLRTLRTPKRQVTALVAKMMASLSKAPVRDWTISKSPTEANIAIF